MVKQDVAILFSGGTDSLALYALAAAGHHPDLRRPRHIHLLHMLNGMSRFHDFPGDRFAIAQRILTKRESHIKVAESDEQRRGTIIQTSLIVSSRIFRELHGSYRGMSDCQ